MRAYAYYNEIDPEAAEWIRELIKAGQIMPGEVDERSIADVCPEDLAGFTQCHFFAGIAGWQYALRLAGWPDSVPVWTGSCPCQDFSVAGKQKGFAGARHLWPEFYRLIAQCRPDTVFGEQVPNAVGLGWLDAVCGDLERGDYAVGALVTSAAGAGAPHVRKRLYWVASRAAAEGLDGATAVCSQAVANSDGPGLEGHAVHAGPAQGWQGQTGQGAERSLHAFWDDATWFVAGGPDPNTGRLYVFPLQSGCMPLAYRASTSVGLMRGYGNAICPQQAASFIKAYIETMQEGRQ